MKLIPTNLDAWYCILLLITKGAYFQFKFLFQITCKKKGEKKNLFLTLFSLLHTYVTLLQCLQLCEELESSTNDDHGKCLNTFIFWTF